VNNHAINGIGSIVASQSFYCRNVCFSSLRSNKKNRIKSRQPQNQNRIKSWALTIEQIVLTSMSIVKSGVEPPALKLGYWDGGYLNIVLDRLHD
jgi:hypothetical protein